MLLLVSRLLLGSALAAVLGALKLAVAARQEGAMRRRWQAAAAAAENSAENAAVWGEGDLPPQE